MLGHAAIAEAAIADVGGNLLAASAELNGVASKTSVGVGILAGIADALKVIVSIALAL